jgi:hypothetical protein
MMKYLGILSRAESLLQHPMTPRAKPASTKLINKPDPVAPIPKHLAESFRLGRDLKLE